jgi:hypothetical protein
MPAGTKMQGIPILSTARTSVSIQEKVNQFAKVSGKVSGQRLLPMAQAGSLCMGGVLFERN